MKFSIVILSVTIGLLLLWLWYRIRYRKLFKMLEGMNDMNALPLIGMAHHFIGKSRKDYFKILIDLIKDDTVRVPVQFWICAKLCILVENLEDIQKILTSPDCYEKGSAYDQAPFPNGLITAKPKIWIKHRKLLNSSFNTKLLKCYINDFNEIARKIVLGFQPLDGKGVVNMFEMIGHHAMDVQIRTLFGSAEKTDVISKLHDNVISVTRYIGEMALLLNCHPIISGLHRCFYLFVENSMLLKLKESCDMIKNILISDGKNKTEYFDAPEIFIKRLVTLRDEGLFEDSDFEDHVQTMLLAGGDTMCITIVNICMMLAMNPTAQDKCRSELMENLGPDFQDIGLEQLNNLDYLNRTLKECLRLFPTVPAIQRKSAVDQPISGGMIPKGVDICIPIGKIHRSKLYWGDDPLSFNPDNFLEENILKRPPLSYFPYSYGNRNCIASKYANWLIRIIFAHILSKYKLTTNLKFDELKFVYGVTMTIENEQLQFIKFEKIK